MVGAVGAAAVPTRVSSPRTNGSVLGAASSQPTSSLPPGSVEQVAAKVTPSVVELQIDAGRQQEEGSGIIVSPDGLILTNNHVIAIDDDGSSNAPRTTVTFTDGRTAQFSVVAADPTTDIAVVRAQGVSGLTPISIGSSANLRVGQRVVAVGAPLGLVDTVTTGIVSALDRPVTTNLNTVLDAVQTDAAINPGNSGGALVNMNGELVGMNSAMATAGGASNFPGEQSGSIGLGFAIPVDLLKRIGQQLIDTGKASHARLGVQVSSDPNIHGVTVTEVTSGGPAAAAGVPTGALITKLDKRTIGDLNAFVAAMESKAPGDKVSTSYTDQSGHTHVAQITLGSDQGGDRR
jgi:putative serine protease PepD